MSTLREVKADALADVSVIARASHWAQRERCEWLLLSQESIKQRLR